MDIEFFEKAQKDFEFWKKSGNKEIQKKIKNLLEDIKKTPFWGIGKPEALKYKYSGMWSRRINEEHRIIYEIENNKINIYSLKGHYEKKT